MSDNITKTRITAKQHVYFTCTAKPRTINYVKRIAIHTWIHGISRGKKYHPMPYNNICPMFQDRNLVGEGIYIYICICIYMYMYIYIFEKSSGSVGIPRHINDHITLVCSWYATMGIWGLQMPWRQTGARSLIPTMPTLLWQKTNLTNSTMFQTNIPQCIIL